MAIGKAAEDVNIAKQKGNWNGLSEESMKASKILI